MSDGEEKGGWWDSWVKSAKDKSVTAFNMVKRDLVEFSSVMQEDTVKAAAKVKEKLSQENANAAGEKVKQGMSHLLDGISKALVIEPDDHYQPAHIVGGEAIVFDRSKARLHAVQIDPSTYTTEPSSERYREWLSKSNLDEMKGDISDLLVSNVEVRALYTQLVPITVSNIDFWRRYYFKRHLLEEDEARRLELMKRAEDVHEQKDLGWDEDDDEWTEARAQLTTIETKETRLAAPATASLVDSTEVSDDALTLNSQNLIPTDDRLHAEVDESDITPTADVNVAESKPLTVPESNLETMTVEVTTQPPTEPEPTLTSEFETSSSSCSEEMTATPPSDNSLEIVAAVVMTTTAADVQSIESAHSSDPSLSGWSGLSDAKSTEDDLTKVMALEKLVVSDPSQGRKTPSDASSNTKESLDDEWERDFDVEVTEDDIQAAQVSLKNADLKRPEGGSDDPEDWEDW